ncbi:hypothetical protein C8J55DRAFT_418707 [Lentinula edodes]|uniref:Hydroxyneurosporene synthase n=1 Tax=Lentinula lateritia TaxID=40482 RepID=A0A9W9AZG4_9AGAR|nr:hypothetical protein C8J55DRAFT_418707 [Lentinula edodes]
MFLFKKIAHSLSVASGWHFITANPNINQFFAIAVLSNFAHAVSFDGQYIQPNLTNTAVEWWWGSAVGASQSPGTPGPVLQFLFYQGYSILADFNHSSLPEYYITINGFFSNGNNFSLTVPATSGNISEGNNNSVTGTWGTVGAFQISSDLKTMAVTFDAPDAPYGISGSMNFTSNRANHYGCNVTDSPYFDVVKPVKTLNDAEQVLFNQLGWAVAIPGGTVNVDVRINGTRLQFTGNGYHDQNWMPLALNEFISSWYFGFAEVGPYTLSYVSAAPLDSSIVFNTGYLATDNAVLQNQCSVDGSKTTDISIIRPTGEMAGAEGTIAPSGWTLNYIIDDGTEFEFLIVPTGVNPDIAIYQRWTGLISGGKKGEESYEGVATFEWLNPGLNVYPA